MPQPELTDDAEGFALSNSKRYAVHRLDRLPPAALHREMLAQVAGDQHRLLRAAAVARIVGNQDLTRYIRTSIAARNPSLTRLQQIEVIKIATPGNAQTNGTT